MAYVARTRCGCVELVIVDDPTLRRDVASEVAGVIKRGGTLERVTAHEARIATPWGCSHRAPDPSDDAPELPEWISMSQAARHMQMRRERIVEAVENGEIVGGRVTPESRDWRVSRSSCDAWLRAQFARSA